MWKCGGAKVAKGATLDFVMGPQPSRWKSC